MPVAVKRSVQTVVSTDDLTFNIPCYYVYVFKKAIPIILFFLSKGLDYCLDYLYVRDVITFFEKLPTDQYTLEKNLFFQLSNKCYIKVDREFFDKYTYIQSIVAAFSNICTNRVTIEQLNDPRQWIKRLATPNNYDKGYSILKYFNRLMDKEILFI